MMTPAKKRITLSQEHAALDLLRQGPARCKPERCSLLLQTADHVGAAHLLALELNARIVAMEFGKETVISGEINAAHSIQPNDTGDVVIAVDLGQRKPRDRTVHIFGDLLHFNARLRHFYARPMAIDQPHAKLILKATQRLTHCRLRQMQPRSRTTHAALPR